MTKYGNVGIDQDFDESFINSGYKIDFQNGEFVLVERTKEELIETIDFLKENHQQNVKNRKTQQEKPQNQQQQKCKCQAKNNQNLSDNKKEQFIKLQKEMIQQYKIQYKSIEDFNKKYERTGFLGSGGYRSVDSIKLKNQDDQNKENEEELAVKRFKEDILLENQENELFSLYSLQLLKPEYRKYVLNIKESYIDKKKEQVSIIIPRALHSFSDEISQRMDNNEYFKPKDLYYLLSCALLGQLSIETIGMAHRDVKLGNLLIMKDGSLIITDLGTTKRMNTHENIQNTILVGTYGYWSPDQINILDKYREEGYIQYSSSLQAQQELKKNDLYGYGLCFMQAATLTYKPKCNSQLLQEYNKRRQKWLDESFKKLQQQGLYSKEFVNLLKKMLEPDSKKRITLLECLESLENLKDW